MKKIILILAGIFLFFSPDLFPQQSAGNSDYQPAIINSWYVEAGGGVQILFSSDAGELGFSQRLTPAISLTGGKWFSPYWGVRLQFMGYSLNGLSTVEGRYIADKLPDGSYGNNDPVRNEVPIFPDGSYRHYLRYLNSHVDVQASAVNLIAGYDINRKWDIIPAVGIGYLRAFAYKGTPATNNVSFNFSILGKYTVYENIDVNLELSTMLFPDKFDGRLTGRGCENNLALTLGVSYNFKQEKDYKPLKNICDVKKREKKPRRQQEVIVERQVNLITEIQKDTIIVENINEGTTKPFVLASILFDLSQTKPQKSQDILLVNISNYMKNNPETKIRIDGYGDKETGTPEENLKISVKRAENVRDVLINQYGVAKNRITVQGLGSSVQPYEKSSWNRVAVINVIE